MTAPSGLLLWGQAGNYDAISDRSVIATLANNAVGMVNVANLSADTGLDVRIGAWSAVVACGDGTSAVIGSNQYATVTPAAGGASSRVDVVWADVDVDGGTWTINLLTTTDIVGRLGIELGRITVPANANVSTAFTLSATAKTWNPFPQASVAKSAAGVVVVHVRNQTSASVAVNFPAGRFSVPPAVVCTTGHGQFFAAASSTDKSGFTATVRHYNDANYTYDVHVQWIAREMV